MLFSRFAVALTGPGSVERVECSEEGIGLAGVIWFWTREEAEFRAKGFGAGGIATARVLTIDQVVDLGLV